MLVHLISVAIVLIVCLLVYFSVETVNESETKLLYVFGEYRGELSTGLNIIPPIFSSVKSVNLQSRKTEVPTTTAKSSDENRVTIRVYIFYKVDEPKTFTDSVNNFEQKIWDITQSEIKSIISEYDSRYIRENQREITSKLENKVSNVTQDWGIEIEECEISSVSIDETDD